MSNLQTDFNLYLVKLIDFKGNVVGSWKAPTNRNQLRTSMRKLLKFYYRAKQSSFLTDVIIESIKQCAKKLKELGVLWCVKYPEILHGFEEIEQLDPNSVKEYEVIEKERIEKREKCSLCGVPLIKPGYVLWKKNGQVTNISKPIGIRCLNNAYTKIQNLTVELDALIRDFSSKNQAASVDNPTNDTSQQVTNPPEGEQPLTEIKEVLHV